MFAPVYISDINCVTPLGHSVEENWHALLHGETGIAKQDIGHFSPVYVGKVREVPNPKGDFSFLENLLFHAALPLLSGKVPNQRTGFILSSTKGNIEMLAQGQAEEAELYRLADKLAVNLGFVTKPIVVSHACVSGLLAVIVAKRLIQMGKFDEVLVVAGDQVSEFVLSGFQAFQAMSEQPCRPFDKSRNGVTLGEASAAAWVTNASEGALVHIAGEGAINDANHISGPSRTGEGLYRSILAALKETDITKKNIDFISAHGTATLYNDEMEAIAFDRAGLLDKPLQGLKGYYGHTLGASGLLELVIAIACLEKNTLLPTKGYMENGTSRAIHVIQDVCEKPLSTVLKTASGFGGSNAAVLLKKCH